MSRNWLDSALFPLANYLDDGPMSRLGIHNTMRLANLYNRALHGHKLRYRQVQYRQSLTALMQENGPLIGTSPINQINDGWALDTSGTLPHLPQLLDEADQVIRERGQRAEPDSRYRAFFRNMITPDDLRRYPSFLNFVCSSEVIATASQHLGFVPCLSRTIPPGIRFTESWMGNDAAAALPPRDSQLYHMDPYVQPSILVIVLLRDVTPEQGPFSFLPASISQPAAKKLNYWSRGKAYRLSDEEVYSVAPVSERRTLCYPKGTVLFIDPTRCFHYGSRNSVIPRYQMMYGLGSPVRTDFTEISMTPLSWPCNESDSRLRKMVLDMRYAG